MAEQNQLYQKQALPETEEEGTAAVASLNKSLHRLLVEFLKIIPMIMAGLYLLNTVLSYFYIDLDIISYIAGVGIIPWAFLYLASFAFKFCIYHRLFLYYIAANNSICWADYKYALPISNWNYLVLHFIVAGLFLFTILYLKFKKGKHEKFK